ncbi:MAG: GTP-binding protein [Gloeomargarita sp. SKYG116]|nr:GTP-binding protein [Gloeomargarita sp. SKYG116]MDW8400328.1 GTP-binding protein [Gloeomargarita sp. SKYGB_i_bin116]
MLRRWRWVWFGSVAVLTLMLLLGLSQNLVNLYTQILTVAGATVANGLLGLLLLVMLGLVLTVGRIVWLAGRPARPGPKRPSSPPSDVQQHLEQIAQQLAQIEDQVTRQYLEAQYQELLAQQNRQPLRLVILGTASTGKTSLVNTLLGRIAGEVAPTLGTTQTVQVYGFRIKGVPRRLELMDTPGLQEGSVAGASREQEAIAWAQKGDLVIWVADNDLRQSEITVLVQLRQLGKRVVLALNKTDLYLPADQEVLLAQIRQRLQGWLAPEDVVPIAAAPPPVTLETGEPYQPPVNIEPLLQRVAAILQTEGEQLIAENLLLQCRQLGAEAQAIVERQRRRQAEAIVERFQWIGAGVVWLTPLPGVDLLAQAAVQAQMVVELGQVYGCRLSLEQGRELALSLAKTLTALGVARGIASLVSRTLKTTVAGYVFTSAVQSVSAAYLTRVAGLSFITYFRQNQSWGEGGMAAVVRQQWEQEKETLPRWVQMAWQRLQAGQAGRRP